MDRHLRREESVPRRFSADGCIHKVLARPEDFMGAAECACVGGGLCNSALTTAKSGIEHECDCPQQCNHADPDKGEHRAASASLTERIFSRHVNM
jgi:hypothetical protein